MDKPKNAARKPRNSDKMKIAIKGIEENASSYTLDEKQVKENGHVIATIEVMKKSLVEAKPGSFYPYYYIRSPKINLEFSKFKTEEEAFHFVVAVRRAYLKEVASRPLKQNLNQYIEQQARTLRERTQAHVSALYTLANEKYTLLTLAREFGVKEAECYIDDSDVGQTINDLLEFKLGEHPFLSESCLYELIGKEDARTILALIGKLIKIVAPERAILL